MLPPDPEPDDPQLRIQRAVELSLGAAHRGFRVDQSSTVQSYQAPNQLLT